MGRVPALIESPRVSYLVALACSAPLGLAVVRLDSEIVVLAAGAALLAVLPIQFGLVLTAVVLPYAYQYVPAATTLLALCFTFVAFVRMRPVPPLLRGFAVLVGVMGVRLLLDPILGGGADLGSVARLLLPLAYATVAFGMVTDPERLVALAAAAIGLPTVIAVWQVGTGRAALSFGEEGRISGGMSSAPELGLMGCLLFVAIWPKVLGGVRGARVVAAVAAFCAVVSGTRGAVLAVLVSIALVTFLATGRTGIRARRGAIALMLGCLLLAPFATSLIDRTVQGLVEGRADFASRRTDTSLGVRAVTWADINMRFDAVSFGEKMVGLGPGATEQIVNQAFSGRLNLPHNGYLRMRTDYGYIGLAAFVVALLAPLVLLTIERQGRFLGLGALSAAVAVLSFTDNPFLYAQAVAIPFVLISVGYTTQVPYESER